MIQNLLPEHAEVAAKYWNPATIEYPLENRIRYLKELISRYGAVGTFSIDDPTQPLSWIFNKTGIYL